MIGIKHTRLAIASFMCAMTGTSLALLGMWYFAIQDWPMNIGGKPSFSLIENRAALVPVTFEFSRALRRPRHGHHLPLRNGTLPGMPATNPDPRTTTTSLFSRSSPRRTRWTPPVSSWVNDTELLELSIKDYAA